MRALRQSALVVSMLVALLAGCSHSVDVVDGGPATPAPSATPAPTPTASPDPAPTDAELLPAALDASMRGCDLLDPANCLYPFPNDHFTVAAAEGSIQSVARGGTGQRVNLQLTATPRNVVGLPVNPAEWNRNDGFSPGALLMTYVPELSLTATFDLPAGQIGIANPALSLQPDAPILVLEVPQAPETVPTPHLVFSELDATAGTLLQNHGEFQGIPLPEFMIPSPNPRAALLIRPAKNFSEGRRYVVVLRNLKDEQGNPLTAQAGFRSCRDQHESALPQVTARCEELEANVFPVLEAAGIARSSVYLAWDFTVASTQSQIGRLRHMRDGAFATLALTPEADCLSHRDDTPCAAPQFTVDSVTADPREGIVKRIEGTITVPSYVVIADPSPAEYPQLADILNTACDQLPDAAGAACDLLETVGGLVASGSLPPNRLYYAPTGGTADASNFDDPLGIRYGDGLPDRLPGPSPLGGTMTTRYLCQIPAQATPDHPARAGIYGHGLLDSRLAVNYDGVPDLSREFNYLFCAVDFFGFATGDLPNVLTSLLDLSLFPVVPDASQQGMVNFMFLTRLLRHPQGFASNPEFQGADGRPLFDRSEVFYDGNSQGGILGGVLMAADRDLHRGVLGSLGMNYSTLLNRSKDFDQYAIVLYAAYQDSLDRQLLFSMMQMLWDRSENDGYAAHLSDNSAFGGAPKIVKLDPQFGDQQVTSWSAEVMARTLGIPADFTMNDRVAANLGSAARHPDVVRGFGLPALDYANDEQTRGGALIMWDDERSAIPPTENLPPRPEPPLDRDPHDDSAKKLSGRCQKAHFLRQDGRLIDVLGVEFDAAACPEIPPPLPTVAVPG
ncbi:MAG: hypothetical protein M3O62_07030 [Pseudomonadota bacterium]|nr:hypothetical protein [Pseudomonadota bacterium]